MEYACDRFVRDSIPNRTRGTGSFSICRPGCFSFECRGLGQVTAMSLDNPEQLVDEIRKTKSMTDKPFGVNFAIGQHGRPYEHMLEAALKEDIAVVSVTGGNPSPFLDYVKGTQVKNWCLLLQEDRQLRLNSLVQMQ